MTGFLGAGKTTLLRRLLEAPHGLRVGVILNERGQAGMDQAPAPDTDLVEIAEGCACCVRNPDLVEALRRMHARGDLHRLILETSGLADPLALTWTIGRPDLADVVRLDAVIGVVDPLNLERGIGVEWEAQVRCSDLVYLSKRDLATDAAITDTLEAVRLRNPRARIVEPDLPLEALLDVWRTTPLGDRPDAPQPAGHSHSDFTCQTASCAEPVDLDALEEALADLPEAVFRAKGIVRTGAHGWAAFQSVGGRTQVEPDAPQPEHGETRIAVFGRGLPPSTASDLLRRAR